MANFKYTASQEAAITSRDTNLLVSAAAGAGKTQVLIDRIVRLVVVDQVPLEQMVVVTFTNAAAGEMKERLQQGLSQAMQDYPEKRAFLYRQLRALPRAHVSTLHAYCIQTMRTYYHVVNLEPNFRVLNDATGVILREKALVDVMEAHYDEADEAFNRLIEAYGGRNNDQRVLDMIQQLAVFLQSLPEAEAWLQSALTPYEMSGTHPLTETDSFVAVLFQHVQQGLSAVAALLEEADALLPFEGPTAVYRETLAADEALVAARYEIGMAGTDVADLLPLGEKPVFDRLKTVPAKKMDEADQAVADRFKALRAQYKDRLQAVTEMIPTEGPLALIRDRAQIQPFLKTLIACTKDYMVQYATLKRKRNEVDYNDLEMFMLKILEDEEAHAAITRQIRFVFFDEYQDCNAVQEAIVNRLAPDRGLFYVGDVKQAIYGFRFADPHLFNDRYACYVAGGTGEVIHLADNFRSVPGILAFCNALFTDLMRADLGEVVYRQKGHSFVVPQHDAGAEAVHLVALESDGAIDERQLAEAMWIAEKIQENVEAKRWRYSDVAILMRAPGGRLGAYETAFKKARIPYYSDNTTVNFDNMEVRLFLNMLQVLNNDCLDTPLAAVLLSPFGGLTDDHLATIRLACPEASFAEACRSYHQTKKDEVGAKLGVFYRSLDAWRKRLQMEPLPEVANALFQESGYAAFLLSLEEGAERIENMQAFIHRMSEFDADADTGLQGFLQYAEVLKQRKGDGLSPGIALTTDDDRVQIMSIHKSKGLGFPVVFVADLSRRFNFRDAGKPLVLHRHLGFAMDVVDLEQATTHTTFERRMMQAQFRQETRSEEVRLFYVALTRAKKELFLVTSAKDVRKEINKKSAGLATDATAQGSSFQDWMFTYLGLDASESALSLAHQGTAKALFTYHEVDAKPYTMPDEAAALGALNLDTHPVAEQVVTNVARCLGFQYPFAEETVLPLKTTVTQLAQERQVGEMTAWSQTSGESSISVTTPLFLQDEIHFTGAEQGTALHRVMQLIPLHIAAAGNLTAAINEMEAKALITPAEAAAVSETQLLVNFFQSDLGLEVLRHRDRVEREVSFTMRKEGYIVDGQIDLIYGDGNKWHIIDFKSDRTINASRYTVQMALYREALEKARDICVGSVHLFWLRHGVATRMD